ncbi:MAG: hypothetical protein EZS28_031593 [Streblomastix strix]|uniref:Uncharacterized protein n=1 Tax=Streblomastix strix TaxID=222440 RepID=A0A5J4URB7_9EUKA|nr:MAG: hypothetical protein EZS28_031593 [Streblomastix strix]
MIYTDHLPGLENSTADALCLLSLIGDYQINQLLLNEALQQINFQHSLVVFVEKINKQLTKHCSPQEDNKAIARNAKNILWSSVQLLQHHSIDLIPKAIHKTIRNQVEAVLILPRWKDHEKIIKITTKNYRDDQDKYKEREQLYRELAELIKLDSVTIDQLIAGINPETSTQTSTTPEEIQQTTMAMIVAFCAACMTVLVFMKQSETIEVKHQRNGFNKETQKQFQKIKYGTILQNIPQLVQNITATNQQKSLGELNQKSTHIEQLIRHAQTARLKAAGATQAEVNTFTRHAMTSNVVDIYYNKPVERDLASMLILNEKRYMNSMVTTQQHVSKTA